MTLATFSEAQHTAFELARAPTGWARVLGVLGVIVLCYVVVWLYRRERRAGIGRALRVLLATLRCLVFLALAFVWLEPVLATYVVRTVQGRVAVLLDLSASMSVHDAPAEGDAAAPATSPDRFEQVSARLAADGGRWLRRLQQRNELRLYTFSEKTVPLAIPDLNKDAAAAVAALDALRPTGPHTDLGQAVTSVLTELNDGPLAGVVLLSDGGVNRGAALEEIVASAARGQAPLYTIGVGSAREPPNLRITGLAAPATVPPDDPFEVRVELAATGVAPREVEVQLTAAAADGDAAAVAAQRVHLDASTPIAPLLFQVKPPPPGEYIYRAHVQPLATEAVTEDNVRETPVLVLEERLRVLIVAGGPSFEYRYLTSLLLRDQSIDLSCWLQSADERAVRDGDTVIQGLPRAPEELFDYDAILLLDPDPTELDAAWAVTVRRWVDELGGGLLLQAGPHFTTRLLRDPRLADLVALLPITPDPDADVRLNAQGTYRRQPAVLRLADAAAAHPLVALHPEPATNQTVWQALPGVWWYLPVLRPKPVATVLLEHASEAQRTRYGPAVLMATQPVGAGRAAFLGFNNTWRWRATAEPCFNRFWVRLVRYLAQARRAAASKRGRIVLDREAFSPGDYVKIEARLLDEAYNPVRAAQVTATLEWPDNLRTEHVLAAIPDRAGWYGGRVLLQQAGPVVISLPLPTAGDTAGRQVLKKRIRVQQPDIEMRTLRRRDELLRALAEQTGGEYFDLEDLGRVPEVVKAATERKPPRRAAVEPLWDRAWTMLVLAALLVGEWTLRRRNHLL